MFLFSKEKEFILKITNAVLLVWFLGALVFTFSNAMNLLVDRPLRQCTGKETNCEISEEKGNTCGCQFGGEVDMENRYEKISFYTSVANVVIVGGALYFLNIEKDTKKKK